MDPSPPMLPKLDTATNKRKPYIISKKKTTNHTTKSTLTFTNGSNSSGRGPPE
jgi:hypothetical protein